MDRLALPTPADRRAFAVLALSLFSSACSQRLPAAAPADPAAPPQTATAPGAFTPRPPSRGAPLVVSASAGSDIELVVPGHQNEVSIAVNPNDPKHWVVASHTFEAGCSQVRWSTTFDAGQNWTSGLTGTFGTYQSIDPLVACDPSGRFHLICLAAAAGSVADLMWLDSPDGVAWSPGVAIAQDGNLNDKPQIDVDFSGGPLHGSVAVVWSRLAAGTTDIPVLLRTLPLGGATWSPVAKVNDANRPGGVGADVAWGPGSQLTVMHRDDAAGEILSDTRPPGGTFGTDVIVTTFTPFPGNKLPGSNFNVKAIFSLAADWTSGPHAGHLYIAYHDWNGANGDLRVTRSVDGGQTWQAPVMPVGGLPGDHFFPSLAVDPRGNVNLLLSDHRTVTPQPWIGTRFARSSDGGLTWRDLQVTDHTGWDHGSMAPYTGCFTQFNSFIGDYQTVAYSDRLVIPVWTEGLSGDLNVALDPLNLDLASDIDAISGSAGGVVSFAINVGPNHGGEQYFFTASLTPGPPGIDLPGGVNVPIQFDSWTQLSVDPAGAGVFRPASTHLDATGSSTAIFDTTSLYIPVATPETLHFTVVTFDASLTATYATATSTVRIDP
ncbi:MAG: sialidase family protein [Planctomycetota bacterium]